MKLINLIFIFLIFSFTSVNADNQIYFKEWKKKFRITALQNNISEETFDKVMKNTKFLPLHYQKILLVFLPGKIILKKLL